MVEIYQLTMNNEKSDNVTPEVQQILSEFQDVFAQPTSLPLFQGYDHAIVLKEGARPINVRLYRYPHIQKNEIEKLVSEMLAGGIIQPSISPFPSPVLLVRKKDGSWHFCVDYRALNQVTVPDKFPIPNIDELLDELHGARVFTNAGVKLDDVPKTTFRTHEGHYEFMVMPFGLTNASATFQAFMNSIFKGVLRRYVLVFFDDILIYSPSLEIHWEHLCVVLTILREHKLYTKIKKCYFCQSNLEYLGHIISKKRVAIDPKKVKAMEEWPLLSNPKELRGFLGLTSYYHRFVINYGKITAPLTRLLKKEGFEWSEEATQAVNLLKPAMKEVPILTLPDFNEPFVLETDASGTGLDAVMSQIGSPIAFFSHALTGKAQYKSVYERELMAIVMVVQKWRHYLLVRHLIVKTYQKTLRFLLEQRLVAIEHQHWLTKLMGFDFEIQYRSGLENKATDALSRIPGKAELHAISIPSWVDWAQLRSDISKDPQLQQILHFMSQDSGAKPGWKLFHGNLFYQGKLAIPRFSSLVTKFLQEFHNTHSGGHGKFLRTYKRVAAELFWEGMWCSTICSRMPNLPAKQI